MAIELQTIDPEDPRDFLVLEIRILQKLTEADFEILVPEIEMHAQQRPIRIFVELVKFLGWSGGVLWGETKFRLRRFSDVQRIAIVGERLWARGMADFCKPFNEAKWRYYDSVMIQEAKKWTRENDEKERLFY